VQASEADGVVRIWIPAAMSGEDEERWVAEMLSRLNRRRATEATDLDARARVLAARYRLPSPVTVRWVDNQHSRWASCSPGDGVIRVSSRLAGFPAWVVDYVLVTNWPIWWSPGTDRRSGPWSTATGGPNEPVATSWPRPTTPADPPPVLVALIDALR